MHIKGLISAVVLTVSCQNLAFSHLSLQHMGFDGQLMDRHTHWQFLGKGYRVYNPVLHRFMAQDSMSPFNKGGVNGYVFASNNPVTYFDPTGHFSIGSLFPQSWGGVAGVGAATVLDLTMGAAFGAAGGLPFAIFLGAGLGALGQATGDMIDGHAQGLDVVAAAGIGMGMGFVGYGVGMLGNKIGSIIKSSNEMETISDEIVFHGRVPAPAGSSWPPEISMPHPNSDAALLEHQFGHTGDYTVLESENYFYVRENTGQTYLPHRFSSQAEANDLIDKQEKYWQWHAEQTSPVSGRPSGMIDGLMWDLKNGKTVQAEIRRPPLRREWSDPATSSDMRTPGDIARSISAPADLSILPNALVLDFG